MEQEERLLSYQKEGDYFPQATRYKKQESCQATLLHRVFPFYVLMIHVLLVFSVLANVYQSTHARDYLTQLSIFPELNSLHQIVKNEHPEHGGNYSKYAGIPSNLTAKAWMHLLDPFYFNISDSELASAGFSSSTAVRVKSGGYLASLGVYHELHCLNQFRNFLYWRSPDTSPSDHSNLQNHLDHCIEVIRLSVMCAADLSLYTFTWPQADKFKFLDAHSTSDRKCVDWRQIEEWSVQRSVGLTPTLLLPDSAQGQS